MTPDVFDPLASPADVGSFKRVSFIGSMQTVAGQAVKMVLQVVSQIVLARLLFPADFGLLAMAYPVIALVGLLNDIGIGEAIIQKDKVEHRQVSTLLWASVGFSALLCLIVIGIAPIAAYAYGDPRVGPLLMVLAVALPLGAAGGLPASILTRQMRFGAMVRIELVAAAVGFAVTLTAAYFGASYWSLVIGQLALTITSGVLGWVACKWRPSRPGSFREVSDHLKFGANLTGANLATFLSSSADNVIIGMSSGPVALGLYDRSYRLVVQPVGQMLAPVSRVALPLLSRYLHDREQYRGIYLDMIRAISLVTLPLMIISIVDGQIMVDLLLGARWTEAGPIFRWISVGGLAVAVNASATWLFVSEGRTASLRRFTTAAAILHVLSFLAGATLGPVYIAAFAAIAFTCVTAPLMLYGATRQNPVSFRDIVATCLEFVPPAVAVLGVCLLVKSLGLGSFATLAVSTTLAYAIFAGSFLAFGKQRHLAVRIYREMRSIHAARGGTAADPATDLAG